MNVDRCVGVCPPVSMFWWADPVSVTEHATTRRARFGRFVRQVRAETGRVSWPRRRQVAEAAAVVLVTTTVLTLLVFGFDTLFGWVAFDVFM